MAQRLVLIAPLAAPQPVPPDAPGSVPTPHGGAPQPAPYFAIVTSLEPEGPGGVPTPPIYLPPGVWPNPPDYPVPPGGVPTPPIYYPPGIWPHPPGHPAHPLPPGWAGLPTHPIVLPPPGIWPSPGVPTHPIVLPDPDAPPGTVWPPLDPPVAESGYIIAWVPGQGYKYVKVSIPPEKPSTKPPVPETPQPKR
jgi:hypothetical protein